MIGGVAIAAPVIFYQLWSFIAPGLYAREKKYVIPFVVCRALLFVGGGYFGYLAAFPITFGYFLSLSGTVGDEHHHHAHGDDGRVHRLRARRCSSASGSSSRCRCCSRSSP